MLYILNYFLGTFNPEMDVIGVEGINKTVGPPYWWVQPTAYHLGKMSMYRLFLKQEIKRISYLSAFIPY